MCDTFVALRSATRDHSVIFGKNSDRDPNEAHEVILIAAADHPSGSKVRCTEIEIPQAAHTHAVLLARPFWIWGAEMGGNEFGVVIGNEAVFTRVPIQKEGGLLGMDLLRLGLERGASAEEALHVMVALLAQFGQGGNCGFSHPFYYHNSFLIADPQEAWVLETAGYEWAAQKVRDVRSISNQITIGSEWDLASPGLVSYAVDRGWCKNRRDFDFSRCYSDFVYTTFGAAKQRRVCTTRLLETKSGDISLADGMSFLRAHGLYEDPSWRPDPAVTGAEVCMHAGFGPIRISQSTGSMLAHLGDAAPTYWVTATSAPCTGIFKPMWVDIRRPWDEAAPQGVFDPACLWWRHEKLHRTVLQDYPVRSECIRRERGLLESTFIKQAAEVTADVEERQNFAGECYREAETAEVRWLAEALAQPVRSANRFYYQMAWSGFNRQARLSV